MFAYSSTAAAMASLYYTHTYSGLFSSSDWRNAHPLKNCFEHFQSGTLVALAGVYKNILSSLFLSFHYILYRLYQILYMYSSFFYSLLLAKKKEYVQVNYSVCNAHVMRKLLAAFFAPLYTSFDIITSNVKVTQKKKLFTLICQNPPPSTCYYSLK